MNDFINVFKGHRLPYLMKIGLVFIGFLIIIPVSSAETLKVLSNTDICKYRADINMDYCKTVYELCDPVLDMKKVDFRFKVEADSPLKSQIDDLSYNYSSKIGKINCREITIEGYKNPYKNVDNVLCYDSRCHEEYVWWNTSFLSKFAINASINAGEFTFPLLLNDSFVTIDGFNQYVWCNYTLNTTRGVVGYFYFTNETFYQCVDRTETFAVKMDVDNGNGTNLNFTYASDVLFVQHMNDGTKDSSSYSKPSSVTGSLVNAVGQIARAQTFDGSNDYISVTSTNGPTGVSPFTVSVWFKTSDSAGTMVFLGQTLSQRSYRLGIASSKLFLGGYGPGGLSLSTSESVDDGNWHQGIAVFFANDTGFLYIDGEFKVSGSPGTSMLLDGEDITIGAHSDAADKYSGELDEIRFWNRSLSGDEIRAIYENQNGTFGIAQSGPVINLSQNVSVRHFDLNVTSFLITSQQYQMIINDTFTLVDPLNLIIKGSAGAMKQDGGGAIAFVSARLIFNGVTLYDQTIRSVRGTGDRGVFTLPIINATGQGGTNTFILQMKRTGVDDINISNLVFHIDTTLSNNDFDIINSLEDFVVNYTSTTLVNIANLTINKTLNSTVLIDIDHRLESTSNNIVVDCFLESEQTGERTLTYSRWLQSSGDVGSSGINHRSQIPFNGSENWMINCKSSTNNMILNNITGYIMDQINEVGNIINGFQNSTSVSGLTGNDNIILSTDYRNAQGPQLEILATIIMQSTSGSQDGSNSPVFTIRTNDSVCITTIERSLASNSDIGTAKIYLNCGGLVPSINNNYEVVVDVASGETLDILNVSLSSYEATPQLVIEGIVPPIVRISSPTNGSNVTERINVVSVIIDLSRTGWQSLVTVINSSGFTVLTLLNESTFGNTSSLTFNTRLLVNGNYTISWRVSNNVGNNSDNVTVFITNIEIVAPPTITFCANGDFLLVRDSSRTISNGNITINTIDRLTFCNYGCSNWTITTLGNPGCEEGSFFLSLIFIITLILLILIIRGAMK